MRSDVAEMLSVPGFYLVGDTRHPGANVPLVVTEDGRMFSLRHDAQLNPERFLDTATLHGPFLVPNDSPLDAEAQRQRDHWTLEAMERDGGGFVKALARAARHADATNLALLKQTWAAYWQAYEARGRQLESQA